MPFLLIYKDLSGFYSNLADISVQALGYRPNNKLAEELEWFIIII
jgi:hypothetical protein